MLEYVNCAFQTRTLIGSCVSLKSIERFLIKSLSYADILPLVFPQNYKHVRYVRECSNTVNILSLEAKDLLVIGKKMDMIIYLLLQWLKKMCII